MRLVGINQSAGTHDVVDNGRGEERLIDVTLTVTSRANHFRSLTSA